VNSTVASSRRLLSVLGLVIALVVPSLAIFEQSIHGKTPDFGAAAVLSLTPWLLLAWAILVERRSLASIGLVQPGWSTLGFGLLGVIINVAISLVMGKIIAGLGWHETDSVLMTQLQKDGPGWLLVLLLVNSALLTEVAFRAYAIESLSDLMNGRRLAAAILSIGLMTAIFTAGRGPHGLVILVDSVFFSAFYLWRRDTTACLIAHALPNFVIGTLVALRLVT